MEIRKSRETHKNIYGLGIVMLMVRKLQNNSSLIALMDLQ